MHRRPNTATPLPRGVGLVQTMVVMACTGVLLSVGAMALTHLQARWALSAQAQRWLEVLHTARATALLRQSRVVLCARSSAGSCANAALPNGWSGGWRLYLDSNANGQQDAAETVLADFPALGAFQHMAGNRNVAYRVVFEADGASNHQTGTWRVCDARLAQGWLVVINILGRARLTPDEGGTCP